MREEGSGRGTAKTVIRCGVVALSVVRELGERMEEEDHGGREGAIGLGGKQVDEVALRNCIAVVAKGGVDAVHARAAVERRVGRTQHLLAQDDGAQAVQRVAKRKGVTVG